MTLQFDNKISLGHVISIVTVLVEEEEEPVALPPYDAAEGGADA